MNSHEKYRIHFCKKHGKNYVPQVCRECKEWVTFHTIYEKIRALLLESWLLIGNNKEAFDRMEEEQFKNILGKCK